MGRPKKAEATIKKNWNVRFSEDDREIVLHNARLLRMTPSAYIRQCATQGTVKIVRETGHDPEKVRALLAIGNNLNQIARALNILKNATAEEQRKLDIFRCFHALKGIQDQIEQLSPDLPKISRQTPDRIKKQLLSLPSVDLIEEDEDAY